MEEIKKCPFCGGEAKLSKGTQCWGHGDYATSITISCKDCCAEVEVADYWEEDLKEKAIKLWNTRTPVDKVIERLEEQAEECKKYWDEFDDEDAFGGMNAYMNSIAIIKEEVG